MEKYYKRTVVATLMILLVFSVVNSTHNSAIAWTMDELDSKLGTWWSGYNGSQDSIKVESLTNIINQFYDWSTNYMELVLKDSVESNPDYFEPTILTILGVSSGLEEICRSRFMSFIYNLDISSADSILDSHMSTIYSSQRVQVAAATCRVEGNFATAKTILLASDKF